MRRCGCVDGVKGGVMIGPNSVIQGDCLEVMKQIPDKSIDLVLTDPPYGINIGSKVGGGEAIR